MCLRIREALTSVTLFFTNGTHIHLSLLPPFNFASLVCKSNEFRSQIYFIDPELMGSWSWPSPDLPELILSTLSQLHIPISSLKSAIVGVLAPQKSPSVTSDVLLQPPRWFTSTLLTAYYIFSSSVLVPGESELCCGYKHSPNLSVLTKQQNCVSYSHYMHYVRRL